MGRRRVLRRMVTCLGGGNPLAKIHPKPPQEKPYHDKKKNTANYRMWSREHEFASLGRLQICQQRHQPSELPRRVSMQSLCCCGSLADLNACISSLYQRGLVVFLNPPRIQCSSEPALLGSTIGVAPATAQALESEYLQILPIEETTTLEKSPFPRFPIDKNTRRKNNPSIDQLIQ